MEIYSKNMQDDCPFDGTFDKKKKKEEYHGDR